jgi:hypothetical protein
MTATKTIATKMETWASTVVPGLNTFPDNPEDMDEAMPVVVADIERKRIVSVEGNLSQFAYEQTSLRVWAVQLTVMVAPDPSWTRTQELYDIVDQLELAIRKDKTLGGQVEAASHEIDVEFPGEVEHPNGTVARAALFHMTVGEQTEV